MCDAPKPLRGAGITLIVAGIMAMAFMGFIGVDKGIEKAINRNGTSNIEQGTRNIEQGTSNIEAGPLLLSFGVRRSLFDVRCSEETSEPAAHIALRTD